MSLAEKSRLAEERRGKMPYHLIRLKLRKAGLPLRSEKTLKNAFYLYKGEHQADKKKTITEGEMDDIFKAVKAEDA